MKKWNKLGAAWMTLSLCLALVGCANASAKTSSLRTRPEPSAKPTSKPLTNEERVRFVQALAPRLSRSTKGLVAKRTPRGSQHIGLAGRFNHMQVAIRGVDGKVQQTCVATPDELDRLLLEKQTHDYDVSGRQP